MHSHKSKSAPVSPGKENVDGGGRRKRMKTDHPVEVLKMGKVEG